MAPAASVSSKQSSNETLSPGWRFALPPQISDEYKKYHCSSISLVFTCYKDGSNNFKLFTNQNLKQKSQNVFINKYMIR
jgi:hypothetical protein